MRGVSSLIVIVLMLLVAISLSTIVYIYLGNLQSGTLKDVVESQENQMKAAGSEIKITDVDKYTGAVNVQNTGRYELKGLVLYIDGDIVASDAPQSLAAGGIATIMPITLPDFGSHEIKITAEPSVSASTNFERVCMVDDDFSGTLTEWEIDKTPQADTTVSIVNNELKIYARANTFAHIQRAINKGNVMIQAKMKISDTNAGATWAPGIILYWSPTNWCRIQLKDVKVFGVDFMNQGTGSYYNYGSINYNTYYWAKIILNSTHITYYNSTNGMSWTQMHVSERFGGFSENPIYAIIGKGSSWVGYTNPTFNNDYSSAGTLSNTYIDDVKVCVGT